MNNFLKDCQKACSSLGDYTKLDITYLADNYCEAIDSQDDNKREIYFAALALRFWKSAINVLNKVKKTPAANCLDYADLPDLLMRRINWACKYRAWQNPEKHTNAQACINQSINTEYLNITVQNSTWDYKKANLNNLKLDHAIGTDSDGAQKTLGDLIADNSDDESVLVDNIARHYISKDVEAIIVDVIGYGKSYVQKKIENEDDTSKKYFSFSENLTAKNLKEIQNSKSFVKYFTSKYNVDNTKFKAALDGFSKLNSIKLHSSIKNTLNNLRNSFTAIV